MFKNPISPKSIRRLRASARGFGRMAKRHKKHFKGVASKLSGAGFSFQAAKTYGGSAMTPPKIL